MGEAVREQGGSVRGFTGAPVVFEGARQQAGERVSSIIEPVILTIPPSSVGTAIIMSEPLPCANFGICCRWGEPDVRIPAIVTTRSDGSRPPVPIDRDQFDGAVRCIF